MSLGRAIRAVAGGLGLMIGIVGGAVAVAVALIALGAPAESRADDTPVAPAVVERPTELVVALSLGDPRLQAGVVRGLDVLLARGLEVELARRLRKQLRIPRIRFVDVRPSIRLMASGNRPWHLAIASVLPSRLAASSAELSVPYLPAGQAVVLRRGLTRPRSLDDLRGRVLCAVRGSDGISAITRVIRPRPRPIRATGDERLMQLLQTGACDAALVDVVDAGRLVEGRRGRVGPVAGRVGDDEGFVVAITRGSGITLAEVDRALRRLRTDGTLAALGRAWLGIDPSELRPLR